MPGTEMDAWVCTALGISPAAFRPPDAEPHGMGVELDEPAPTRHGMGVELDEPAPTSRRPGGSGAAMTPDCKPVRGYVPGPAEHLLCATHKHIVDVKRGIVIASSLEEYKKLKGGPPPRRGGATTTPDGHGMGVEIEQPQRAQAPGRSRPDAASGDAGGGSFLSGDVRVDDAGNVAARGAVASVKTADGQDDFLSGEAQVNADGSFSAKGVIARSQHGGVTDTVGAVELSSTQASVVGVKKEVDFNQESGLLPGNVVVKGDIAAGTASAGASFTKDGISVGLGANEAEGSLTFGTSGSKRADGSQSDLDTTTRIGLSEGVGLAGRIHFGDADKDGTPEIGVGADIGFVSFDVKSEDPMRVGIGIMAAASGPIGSLATALGPAGPTNETNVTKTVVNEAGGALGALSQMLGSVDVRQTTAAPSSEAPQGGDGED